jgi:hypothetical protein
LSGNQAERLLTEWLSTPAIILRIIRKTLENMDNLAVLIFSEVIGNVFRGTILIKKKK